MEKPLSLRRTNHYNHYIQAGSFCLINNVQIKAVIYNIAQSITPYKVANSGNTNRLYN